MILDELALLTGSRLLYLPALCFTLWSLSGVFIRHWRIGEVFFWFWCELLLSGLSGILLVYRWERVSPLGSSKSALKEALSTACACALIGFFTTLFGILAWTGDFDNLSTLPVYVHDHKESLFLLACGFVAAHLIIVHRRGFPDTPKKTLLRPLTNKMWPVLGLYLVMIEQYHLTGSTKLDINSSYLLMMAGALLGFKLVIELWHLLRGRPDRAPAPASSTAHPTQREIL